MRLCFEKANEDAEASDSNNENPADELVRYEFVEMIVMLSDLKFKASGKVKLNSEAFAIMWHDQIQPWFLEQTKVFKDFKVKLYSTEVDQIFKLNGQLIQQLYNKYTENSDKRAEV